ncbi:hypothetical protein [Bdellovibrio sp. HCB337]|uniref:hypothetical protein n=1 Tax=Bdellovibrio sp. HCB337 TaxID=3394358 RepID=UPI0039A74498
MLSKKWGWVVGAVLFFAGVHSDAQTDLEVQKAVYRQALKSFVNTERVFTVMALNEKTTDSMIAIAHDLRDNNVPGAMPRFELKDDKILMDGKDSGVAITSYSPLSFAYQGRTWVYNKKLHLDETYFASKKFLIGPRKRAGLMRLFVPEAFADRLRPTEAPNPNGKEVLQDVGVFYTSMAVAGLGAATADAAAGVFSDQLLSYLVATEVRVGSIAGGLGTMKVREKDPVVTCTKDRLQVSVANQESETKFEVVNNAAAKDKYKYLQSSGSNGSSEVTTIDHNVKLLVDRAAKHCFDGNMQKDVTADIKKAIAYAHTASFAHMGPKGAKSSSEPKTTEQKGKN